MENPFIEYYAKQAGTGITGYSGNRYHVGGGIFGKIFKHLKPALKYIGRQGWDTFKSMSSDVMGGDTVADAGMNSLIKTTQNVINDASQKLEKYKRRKQTGGGKRKGKKKKLKISKKDKSKVKKRRKKVKSKAKKGAKKKKKVYKKRSTKRKPKVVSTFF